MCKRERQTDRLIERQTAMIDTMLGQTYSGLCFFDESVIQGWVSAQELPSTFPANMSTC